MIYTTVSQGKNGRYGYQIEYGEDREPIAWSAYRFETEEAALDEAKALIAHSEQALDLPIPRDRPASPVGGGVR